MIRLFINETSYVNFLTLSIRKSFINLCNSFTCQLSIINLSDTYPIKLGDKFIVYNDNEKIMTGYIEQVEEQESAEQALVTISGRDLTADLIDTTLDGTLAPQLSGSFHLDELAQKLIDKLNLPIRVTFDSVSSRPFFTQGNYVTPKLGESGYSYLERYAKKSQVYLNTTPDGNLNIASPDSATLIPNKLILVKEQDQPQNNNPDVNSQVNILQGKLTFKQQSLFNKYRCHAQQHKLPVYIGVLKNTQQFNEQVNQVLGVATLDKVRPSRIYNFVSDVSMDKQTATKRAELQANYCNSNYFQYEAIVRGFTYDGQNLWKPNLKVHVQHTNRINGILLISEVEYNLQTDGGQKTRLICVYQDSFSLQAKRTAQQQKSQQVGNVYDSTQ